MSTTNGYALVRAASVDEQEHQGSATTETSLEIAANMCFHAHVAVNKGKAIVQKIEAEVDEMEAEYLTIVKKRIDYKKRKLEEAQRQLEKDEKILKSEHATYDYFVSQSKFDLE